MSQAAHILRFSAKPDSTDELVAVFNRALPYILEDPTTVSWFVGRSEDDPTTFVLAHAFENEEAREAHFKGPAATLIMTEGAPFFAAEPKIDNVTVRAAR